MKRIFEAASMLFLFYITCLLSPEHRGKDRLKYPASSPAASKPAATIAIYLSFDDGIIKESKCIDSIAYQDSVKITVFLIGQRAVADKQAKEIYNAYKKNPFIEVGNHSFTHANKKYKSYYRQPEQVVNDMLLNEDTLHLIEKIARLPGRNVWRVNSKCRNDLADAAPAADSLAHLGYRIFGWDIEWGYDSATHSFYSADEMIKRITGPKKTFEAGNIVILCHDEMLADLYFRSQLCVFVNRVKKDTNLYFEHLIHYPR